MSNNWTIRLGKNVLATQTNSIESNFVRIIHNEFIPFKLILLKNSNNFEVRPKSVSLLGLTSICDYQFFLFC